MAYKISIIIPVRNEAKYIIKCLSSLLSQVYAGEIEILVVDGESTDNTVELIQKLQQTTDRIKLFTNPHRTTPYAMNIGLANATGDIVTTVGGHWEIGNNFLRDINRVFQQYPDVDCLGGSMIREAESDDWGSVIEAARKSRLGGGLSSRNDSSKPECLTTEANIAYIWRRKVFSSIGNFDTFLTKNQDNEFNLRTLLAGFKTLYAPSISFTYFAPDSPRKLWRQMFSYASYTPLIALKHRRLVNKSFIAPMIAMLIWLAFAGLAVFIPSFRPISLILLLLYGLIIMISAWMSLKDGMSIKEYFKLCFIFILIHLAVALGYMRGCLRVLEPETFQHAMKGIPELSTRNRESLGLAK